MTVEYQIQYRLQGNKDWNDYDVPRAFFSDSKTALTNIIDFYDHTDWRIVERRISNIETVVWLSKLPE